MVLKQSHRYRLLQVVGIVAVVLTIGTAVVGIRGAEPRSAEIRKPNVVFILADDWGIGDVKCSGGDRCRIATPHMDTLAADGIMFTDAHSSSSVCTPTRYSILTGRYNWRSRHP